jgi:predicted dehydrogenase
VEKLTYGIIGLGHIAEKAYLKAAGYAAGAELIAVCDKDKSRLALADGLGVSTYSNYGDMIAKEKPDFIVALTPHNEYHDIIKAAARRGIGVFKEKPLGRDLKEAKRFVALAEKNEIKLGVGLQRRFSSLNRNFESMKNAISGIFFVEGKYTMHVDNPGEGWRGQKSLAGGGCIIDMGYHMLDMLIWYFGMPEYVHAYISTAAMPKTNYDAEDTALVSFKYGNGAYGSVTISRYYYPKTEYVKAVGNNFVGALERESAELINKDGRVVKRMDYKYDMVNLAAVQIDNFCRLIKGDKNAVDLIPDNLRVMSLIDAIYASANKGRYVKVNHAGV